MDAGKIEFWAFILTVIGLVISMIKMWSVFVKEHTILQENVLSNKKEIEESRQQSTIDLAAHTQSNKVEFEQVRCDRADRVRAVYEEIAELKRLRLLDTSNVSTALEHMTDQLHRNTVELTRLTATFEEYRKNRNGHSKTQVE